jgi:hypothetical protein
LSAAVKAADKKTEGIVKMLAAQANHIAWGQTYSAQDFGVGFLEKYGWTEPIGLRGPIALPAYLYIIPPPKSSGSL